MMFINSLHKYVVFFLIVFLTNSTILFAMQSDEETGDAPHTPPLASVSQITTAAVEETLGKILAQRQAQFLDPERFRQVIGAEIVASWPIDWDAFVRDPHTPHTSEKFLNLHSLMSKLRPLSRRRTDEEFIRLFQDVLLVKDGMESVHLERLEGVVAKYFSAQFPGSEITFETKKAGVQLGIIAKVKEPGGKENTFYVKTHSEGKRASKSSAAKRVSAQELLVYQILTDLGIGCEALFCARSPEDVYIATRDAAEGGEFFLFKEALQDEAGVGGELWGSLNAIDRSPRQTDKAVAEVWIAEDSVSHNFVQQIVTLDALSRLFKLHDLLNNPDNFGFFRVPAGSFEARILDFRLPEKGEALAFTDSHFGGFLEGNGLFNYGVAHRTLGFILRERLKEQRIKTTLSVLTEGPLCELEGVIKGAHDKVARYLKDSGVFGEYTPTLIDDLTTCRETFERNREGFLEKLQSWRPAGQDSST